MKKFLTSILAFIYLGTTIGATVNMHYCMGKLANWSLSAGKANNCGKCGMPYSLVKGKHCCNDEQKTIRTNADQKAADASYHSNYFAAPALPSGYPGISNEKFDIVTAKRPVYNGPPSANCIPIYLLNCVFRN